MAAVDGGEFHLLAAHAHGRLRVGHPDRCVLAGGRFSAFFQQVRNTLADVAHPLGLLCCCCSIDGEGFGGRFNEPAIAQFALILHSVYGDALQRDDVLLIVFLLQDDDVAVHQDVIEEEELPGFGFFAAQLCENTLPDEHSTWDGQRLTCCAKACFHEPDALRVGLTVCQAVHHLSDAWESEIEK